MAGLEVGAAAAAATAGGVGMGLFSYNRGNYMFDQKNHYSRFTAGLNMAIAQTGLYKQDIEQLTELTVSRQDCYHGIAAMGLTILTAIYCPGRLGLHTSPPPGWLMGLEFVNIAGCYMFLGLALWLAMHASMRADTASTHMLTRFVRLPIPSQGMLDTARKFLSSFEEQPMKEVLRVPFIMSHQAADPKNEGGFNEGMSIDDAAKRRSRHDYDVPAWYRKEKDIDNRSTSETIGSMMPLDAKGESPEHFQAYREIQMEWFPYDVYSRLSIFLAFMHLVHCWTYLQIGHQLQETRALFACAIVVLPMFVLQQVILTLDIVPSSFPIHRLGPCALWTAYIAAVIEYKRWYTPEAQVVGFVLVYVSYAIHIIYTLSLLRLCRPSDEAPAVAETPGASWWPGEWRLPSAFQHAIWLVAPPKKIEEGQVDIVGELRAAQRDAPSPRAAPATDAERRADVHRALGMQGESPAWVNVKIGLIVCTVAWIWLTVGFTIEVLNQGTAHPSLLSAPGVPNHARDPRYRPAKIGAHEVTEVGTGGVEAGPAKGVHSGAVERRLHEASGDVIASMGPTMRQAIAEKVREVLPYLHQVQRNGGLAGLPQVEDLLLAGPTARTALVRWPALFEPQMLACGPHGAAALSRHGRGALMHHRHLETEELAEHHEAAPFALEGAIRHGPLIASSWDDHGLLLVTKQGAVLHCPGGGPVAGRWKCEPMAGARLPLGRDFSGSVAVTRSGGALRAAVLFPGDGSISLFARTVAASSWLPSGEVRASLAHKSASFSADGEVLVLTTADGAVSHLRMRDGAMSTAAPRLAGFKDYEVSSACGLPAGSLARLALSSNGANQEPKLLLG
mmetsp:Transcript_39096/g.112361  ORF Transcript_39096/g.112361 Transcript_39096/m.112361 type:complete len:845 (+) Transcript_39096:93-2627(+)|eukprot:CAMPEP_0176106444 /NCGR_PEP_ID=MMETSP0120_2-20121206/53417_1 /TAXON_ID=160619 /ORGANISM="Kryptoperidinium foliaceum, Strain CCMP 1326" /LENGTH=844 /DNA_ID=CAMNT_0017440567 /DNA_START=40 /DNA_END=2574 /DNA_ORIENTATION=-